MYLCWLAGPSDTILKVRGEVWVDSTSKMATMVSVLTFSPTKKMFQIGPVVPKKDPKAHERYCHNFVSVVGVCTFHIMISKTAGLIETKSSFNGLLQRLCFVPIGMDPVQGAENCVFYISNFNDFFLCFL
jgi:hypothetical protein